MDFNDPKEFHDPLVSDDPKGISIGSMDFDTPKVYSDTSIFDSLVLNIVMINFALLCVVMSNWRIGRYHDPHPWPHVGVFQRHISHSLS